MNRRILLLAALFILVQTGLVWAQSSNLSSHPTSLSNHTVTAPDPLNQRWHTLKAQILSDVKNGKFTQAQGVEMVKKLKTVHAQTLKLKRQNSNRQLTPDQKTQINSQLDTFASNL
jgi:hypothetical protein